MLTTGRITSFVRREPWNFRVEFVLAAELPNHGGRAIAAPLVFEHLPTGQAIYEPTFSMEPEDAQLLMDELWRAGLRPTEGTGSAGSLAATERHLKDMQTIAMGLLKGEF